MVPVGLLGVCVCVCVCVCEEDEGGWAGVRCCVGIMSAEKSLTPNPLFSESGNRDLGEERRSLVSGEEIAFPPAMQMKGSAEMQTELGTLRRRTCAFSIFVLIQAAITLGVAVFAMLLMQEYGVNAGGLYTTGKFGGLKASDGKPLHAGSSRFDNLDLTSSMPDSYFSKLQQVNMSFDMPKEPVTEQNTVAPSPATTRRGMMTLTPVPGEPQMLRHSVSAVVEGFTRSPCAVCASGSQVVVQTNLSKLLIRDNVVIPFFHPEHFHGLDVESLGIRVANEQVKKLHGGNTAILAGIISIIGDSDDETEQAPNSFNSHGRKLLRGNTISMSINHDFNSFGGSNHIDASYSHSFGGSSSAGIHASYNPGSGEDRVSANFSLKFG